jgi:serine/threonine-protein kinase
LKLAARGGMGDVYLAATMGIEGAERPCIVKTVRRDHIHDGSFLARFLDEARVQAQLQHPGVAQVLEAATDEDGEPYTVVEYVEGRSLSDVRQRAIQTGVRIGWADAAAITIEVAQALAHVHERSGADGSPLGIVHRDLSPQNVMIGHAGEIKLIDFGTARGHNRRCHTVAGVVFAKPGYIAPEVARQQVGDGRIDLYALGVILWELCAGRRFLTMDPQRHLDEVAGGKLLLPPVAAACGAPPELDDVIAKLTKNEPDERYPRASLAVTDLARLLASASGAEAGERGVRARAVGLMHALWPHEPARARTEFMRLLREARQALHDDTRPRETPVGGPASQAIARQWTSDASRLPGTPYRFVRTIGEGASGVVWEAEHLELGRRVALKVLAPEHASSAASLERFRREARAVATLSHPNLVQILDFGRSLDGRAFLAMELLAGETLDARLRRGPLGAAEATRIAVEVCAALAAAHAAGLVHRDIKPQNLMLTKAGGVKLLDFGVAMAMTDGLDSPAARPKERALRGFAIFGTPEYMAPEQVSGEAIDRRTDVYALGCVLYQMLAGVPPFEGSSSVVVMGKQLRDTAPPPHTRAGGQTGCSALEAVTSRAMAKDPRNRFHSAAAMRAALEETRKAPERRRAHARRFATGVLTVMGMLAAAAASAHWTRSHVAIPQIQNVIAAAPQAGAGDAPSGFDRAPARAGDAPSATSPSTPASTSAPSAGVASSPTFTADRPPVPRRMRSKASAVGSPNHGTGAGFESPRAPLEPSRASRARGVSVN